MKIKNARFKSSKSSDNKVVDKSGKLHDARVIEGLGGGCDVAALEALKKRRQWIPGKVRGKVVNQRMVLPITFKL